MIEKEKEKEEELKPMPLWMWPMVLVMYISMIPVFLGAKLYEYKASQNETTVEFLLYLLLCWFIGIVVMGMLATVVGIIYMRFQ